MAIGVRGSRDPERDFFGDSGLLNDHEEKAMTEEETKAIDYRSPAGHAPPEKPAKFFVVYTGARISGIRIDEFDTQSQAEQHIVQLREQVSDAKPVIFYGHMSRPQVKQHVTYTVEYK